MPLDADVAELVAALAASNAPALSAGTVDSARANYVAAPRPEPDALSHVVDRVVRHEDREIPVRCYCIEDDPHNRPIIMFAHGGGWVLSSVDGHDHVARRLALTTGALVVSVDYRLAPEHPFPAAHDDCWAVYTTLLTDGATWGGNPQRIVVAGDSAGANLAAGVGLRARDQNISPAAQILIYPCIDVNQDPYQSMRDNASGYFLTAADMTWFWGHYLGTSPDVRTNPYAVPARSRDLVGLPPTLVITAEFDPLRDEGQALATRMAADGVIVEHWDIPGVIHGFIARWHQISRAETVHNDIGNWFAHNVGSQHDD